LSVVPIILAGRAPEVQTEMGWYKNGITQTEFTQDRYDCLKDSRTSYSNAFINPYGGTASRTAAPRRKARSLIS
jgi:hypothetical protein